jgi:hypothetical protein
MHWISLRSELSDFHSGFVPTTTMAEQNGSVRRPRLSLSSRLLTLARHDAEFINIRYFGPGRPLARTVKREKTGQEEGCVSCQRRVGWAWRARERRTSCLMGCCF